MTRYAISVKDGRIVFATAEVMENPAFFLLHQETYENIKSGAGTVMVKDRKYVVGVLPGGFDIRKARVDVREAAQAGSTLTVTVRKASDGTAVWTATTAAVSLAAVKATYFSAALPGPLTEACEVVIAANADVAEAAFSVEMTGDVFGVAE